jgi:hypothetical protein
MNCREFQDGWDEMLDARSAPPADLERALESHASACPRCGVLSARYQVLSQAIATLRPPAPSAESIERLYRLTVPSTPPVIPIGRPKSRTRRLATMAVAASAFALAWLGGDWWPSGKPAGPRPPGTSIRVAPRRALGAALAEATEATLDLAREASVPASRIGREVLDLGRLTTSGLDLPPKLADKARPTVEADSPAPDLLKAVGERVGAGVRPLSGSARHAFGFLLGAPDKPGPAVPPKRDSL